MDAISGGMGWLALRILSCPDKAGGCLWLGDGLLMPAERIVVQTDGLLDQDPGFLGGFAAGDATGKVRDVSAVASIGRLF